MLYIYIYTCIYSVCIYIYMYTYVVYVYIYIYIHRERDVYIYIYVFRRDQTCHFRKRTTSVPAEGPAYGLLRLRNCFKQSLSNPDSRFVDWPYGQFLCWGLHFLAQSLVKFLLWKGKLFNIEGRPQKLRPWMFQVWKSLGREVGREPTKECSFLGDDDQGGETMSWPLAKGARRARRAHFGCLLLTIALQDT